MSEINIKNASYELISSSEKGFKEVQVIFDYQGQTNKYFIFIEEGENVDYIKEAKTRFAKDVASGEVYKWIGKLPHAHNPFLITSVCVLGAFAITFATLYTYKALNGEGGGGVATYDHIVTFESNGGSHIDTIKVKDNQTIIKPENPTRDECIFCDWYTSPTFEGDSYNFDTPIKDDLTLYAHWGYNITYMNLEGSTTDNPTQYTRKDSFALKNPTDHGYQFTGWHLGSLEGQVITEITQGTSGKLVLYASWETSPTNYAIHYENLQGSTTDNPNTYTVTTNTIALNNPTDHGYQFTGWHLDSLEGEKITEISKGSVGEKTLYASWDATPTEYTITYHLDGGTGPVTPNPTTYSVTNTIKINDPSLTDFDFKGWYLDEEKTESFTKTEWNPGEMVGNIDLYADWKLSKTLEEHDWNEIKEISESGNASKCFDIGDTKNVMINNKVHEVRIIGFNHDTLTSDTTKTAGITFEFANVITESEGVATSTYWNNTADNTNFPESTLNTLLNDPTNSIYTKLKAVTGDVIKQVKKGVGTSNDTAEATPYELSTYDTYLFPLAHDEMADHDDKEVIVGEGSKYEYYVKHSKPDDLVKTAVGSTDGKTYWNRSPKATPDYRARAYCFNSSDTKFNFGVVSLNEGCVAPAFCI